MPASPRPAPVSGVVCALHPSHRHGRSGHTPSSAPPTHPRSTAVPPDLLTACLRRSNPHRRISLRFRPTRFLSTVAAAISGPRPRAVAPRRHTKNALRLGHAGNGAFQRAPPCLLYHVRFYVLHTYERSTERTSPRARSCSPTARTGRGASMEPRPCGHGNVYGTPGGSLFRWSPNRRLRVAHHQRRFSVHSAFWCMRVTLL